MKSIAELEKEIAEKTAEIDRLKKAEEELDKLGVEYKMAIRLHECLCHHNHTDGCGWHYEIKNGIHDWNGREHQFWLFMTKNFYSRLAAENISEEIAFKVFSIFQNLKYKIFTF